jgi:hypothetical protein
MGRIVDHTTLHRAAKYFMDSGKAATHDAAMDLLERFGLTIHAGAEIGRSADSRPPPDRSKWNRSQRPFVAMPK